MCSNILVPHTQPKLFFFGATCNKNDEVGENDDDINSLFLASIRERLE
jgi:hypothetical protein